MNVRWKLRRASVIADQTLARENVAVSVTEIGEGLVYDRDGVHVTAFEVDHGDLSKPAFSFHVDSGGARPSYREISDSRKPD